MFVFSVNAKAREAKEGVEVGEQVPFIVYINFQDMFVRNDILYCILKCCRDM